MKRIAVVSRALLLLLLTLWLLAGGPACAQSALWAKNYGGTWQDGAFDITETKDGGLIVTGFNSSQNPGHYKDLHLLRTDSAGNVIWSRNFRGTLNVWGSEVLETPDGGFIAAGAYEVNSQTFDSYVVRTDANGDLLWQRWYDAGLGDDDRAHAICLTSDGGFMIAGQAWQLEPPFGSYDVYVVKCNGAGVPEWWRFYKWADGGGDVALSVGQTEDAGFLIGGFTQAIVWKAYVIRTDPLGNPIWQKIYGGDWSDEAHGMRLTPDGGFVLTGPFISNAVTDTDVGLVKADADGNVEWERVYGGNDADWGEDVWPTYDGGYLVGGFTASFGAGSWDGYVLRADPAGTLLWSMTFGGSSDDRAYAIEQTNDGDAVVAGWAWSFGAGLGDVHVVKIDDGATVDVTDGGALHESASLSSALRVSPNPFSRQTRFELGGPRDLGRAVLRIFDVNGREVRTLLDGRSGALSRSVIWDGRDDAGRLVAPGSYLGTVRIGREEISTRIVRIP